jgi:hypothetical protein
MTSYPLAATANGGGNLCGFLGSSEFDNGGGFGCGGKRQFELFPFDCGNIDDVAVKRTKWPEHRGHRAAGFDAQQGDAASEAVESGFEVIEDALVDRVADGEVGGD